MENIKVSSPGAFWQAFMVIKDSKGNGYLTLVFLALNGEEFERNMLNELQMF